MLGRRKRHRGPDQPVDANPYPALRDVALRAVENGLQAPSADHPGVSGVVVDIPSSDAFATVVGLTDSTTSMYTSTGGGTIGAGEHAEVAAATHALLTTLQRHLADFTDADDGSLPPEGAVRFHLLTPTGSRRLDVPEASFWGREPHDLGAVIGATQELISAMRRVSPQ
ncbi:MAG TPA: hypothetical protein VFV00_01055 [Acidimicrobiales bacterium]|nr:hypothetical protein [Acidimicrobiales bacterium]